MPDITRREFIELAASFGATLAWRTSRAASETVPWRERRDFYPQGVASADPHPDSVILWTRRPPLGDSVAKELTVVIAADSAFRKIAVVAKASVSQESDRTCRFLAARLKPRREYWYRFTDEHGFGSRVGRTLTAPAENDERSVRFRGLASSLSVADH